MTVPDKAEYKAEYKHATVNTTNTIFDLAYTRTHSS